MPQIALKPIKLRTLTTISFFPESVFFLRLLGVSEKAMEPRIRKVCRSKQSTIAALFSLLALKYQQTHFNLILRSSTSLHNFTTVSYCMTGKSHLASNGAVCLAMALDPVVATATILCARLPDQAEKFLPGVKHRTVTHHLYFWAGMTCFFLFAPIDSLVSGVDPFVSKVALGIFAGGLIHVIMDMFSKSGVPLYPGKVWGARVYTTGSYSEYLFLGLFILICGGAFLFSQPAYFYSFLQSLGF